MRAQARLARDARSHEWGEQLIRGWNSAGWIDCSRAASATASAGLIGAPAGTTVVMGDTLSIKVYQALASALELNRGAARHPVRQRQLPVRPLHRAEAWSARWAADTELRIVEPEEVDGAIDDSVAVLMLTEVDYRTGRLHDMTGADPQGACRRRA